MKRILLGALLLGSGSFICMTVEPASAQGVYIGPGGVGVDPGLRDRDDNDRERYRGRERYRDRDSEDDRPRRRRHRDDDDQ